MANEMDKLAEAADELIKIISTSSIQEDAITIGNEAVKILHQLSKHASSVETLLESWKVSEGLKTGLTNQFIKKELALVQKELAVHGEKLANVEDKLADVKEELVILNESIATQTKYRNLEWAISNSSLHSFKFIPKNIYGNTDIVRDILLHFRMNYGYDISDFSLDSYDGKTIASAAKSEEKFRKALSTQIYFLTGQEPRIELEDDDRWFIYYS